MCVNHKLIHVWWTAMYMELCVCVCVVCAVNMTTFGYDIGVKESAVITETLISPLYITTA